MSLTKLVVIHASAYHQHQRNMNLIVSPDMQGIPVIKLIRTDTTLDLSQKAEKNGQYLGSPENELSQARARVECGFIAR